jgi:hypothetical protein
MLQVRGQRTELFGHRSFVHAIGNGPRGQFAQPLNEVCLPGWLGPLRRASDDRRSMMPF